MTVTGAREPIALKEWAVSVKALQEGKQIIVMRKGGIVEETRDFQLMSHRFYLMPAYEHQKKELLKEAYRDEMDKTLADWSPDDEHIKLEAYAEVAEDIEINDQETLDKLRDHHIWSDTFAEERLKWRRKKPLHLLILRVYKLGKAVDAPMRPAYSGCKSWVRLEDDLEQPDLSPALTDDQFHSETARIKEALAYQS